MRISSSKYWMSRCRRSENVVKLTNHLYGKARVRLLKVMREGARHSLKELDVQVMLHGDFESSYTAGDNHLVVATDTMKNTVNVFAQQKLGAENEEFAAALAGHFLATYAQVNRVEVKLSEHCWERMVIADHPHPHSFREHGLARPTAHIVATRAGIETESGLQDLLILKSAESGFENFLRDSFTTLPETHDRIFATQLTAVWKYAQKPSSYSGTNKKILTALLRPFAENYSPSVQTTLFQMGEAALNTAPEISRVHLTMSNRHCLSVNLSPFGLENRNELFVPTDEPHGQIEGTVER